MEGLHLLVSSQFGVELRVTQFHPDENWHPSVFRLELIEEDQSLAGVVYLGRLQTYPKGPSLTEERKCRSV
jgi:Zn-dependent oligopeptidase